MPYVVELPDLSYHFLVSFVKQAHTASVKANKGAMIQSLTNTLAALEKAEGKDVVYHSNPPAEMVTPAPKRIRAVAAPTPVKQEAKPLACTDHPKYTAQRSPRSECKACWAMYGEKHPERMVARG